MAKRPRSSSSKFIQVNEISDHKDLMPEPENLAILNVDDPNLLMQKLQNSFGSFVRKTRLQCHLTQTELGNLVGMGTPYISKIELGQKNLTLKTMCKLTLVMGHDLVISFKKINPEKK